MTDITPAAMEGLGFRENRGESLKYLYRSAGLWLTLRYCPDSGNIDLIDEEGEYLQTCGGIRSLADVETMVRFLEGGE